MTTVEEFAPAKINLTLHITGQRADGYHLLDSLVCFANVGDRIRAEPLDSLHLTIDGPEADDLTGKGDNLVLRAARLMSHEQGAQLRLTKNLPVASGIGGGSTDAAATLRALSRLFDQ
ncbi:MAG: 4-(cytidine 5'-diphospho)-2-C-methyl-D-erythritol kinase, partial [Arenibacterium sp.]